MRNIFHRLKKRYTARQRRNVRVIRRVSRHPAVAIPAITISLLVLLSGVTLLLLTGGKPQLRDTQTHVVIISHDNVEQTLPTRADTVQQVLVRAGIVLHDGDVVEPSGDTAVVSDNFRVNVYRAVPVTIVDGTSKTFAYSAAKTPRSIVKQSGIEVYPEDDLALLPAQNFLLEGSIGERVVIERATSINLNIYGTQVMLRTHAKTIGDLLKERQVKLGPSDTVQPVQSMPVVTGMQIFLVRKGTQIATQELPIDMPRQVVEDSTLSFGTVVTRQVGSPGRKLVTYQVQLENGQEVARKEIQEVVTVEPVTNIVARGKAVQIPSDKQAVMAAAGIAVSDYPYVDYIVSHESGWCPTKLQGQIGYCPPYAPDSIPSYLGYGLGQATPATKMAPFGGDWKTSAVTQLRWASSYAKTRHGSWAGAYDYWFNHHNW